MMVDQLNHYVQYLKKHGYPNCNIVDGQIYINLSINYNNIILKCKLGSYFPYEFPKIYLINKESDELMHIPHLDANSGLLCLFDKGQALPNYFEPEKLLLESIQKAVNNISDGLSGNNKFDFIKEFTSYWYGKTVKADSFLNGIEEIEKFVWVSKENASNEVIIAKTDKEIEHFISITESMNTPVSIMRGLCVDLCGRKLKKIPYNDTQVNNMILKNAYDTKSYSNFMQKYLDQRKLIIMKIHMNNGIILAGWIFFPAKLKNGFRKGHEDIQLAYLMKHTHLSGQPVEIRDCSQLRLFRRGSDGGSFIWESVALLGCGSIGSTVAELFMRLGTTKYLLVDNDSLTVENIARHYCGYGYVGMKKTHAVERKLCFHNPNIQIKSLCKNIHEVMDNELEELNNNDIIVVSVANMPVEHHIVKCVNEGKISRPLLILWMEPYGLGGHALYIHKFQNLYEDLFSKQDLHFRYGIVKDSERYFKREAGCESSYMPYSGFSVSMFVHSIFDYIMDGQLNDNKNYLLTWIGKISEADEHQITINEEYKHKKNYEILVRRVD